MRRRSRGPRRCYGRRLWLFHSHARDPALENTISNFQAHIHNTAPAALRTKNPTREGWMRALCHGRFIFWTGRRRAASHATRFRRSPSDRASTPAPLRSLSLRYCFCSGRLRCLLVYPQHFSLAPTGPTARYPAQNRLLPRIIFAPPVVGREAVQCASMTGPGPAFEARNTISPFMPCQSVACRRYVSLGTFLYFYQLAPPAHLISHSTSLRA
jgi:hypothetical protein